MPNIGGSEVLVFAFIGVVLIWPYWRIFAKAGFPGWYALSALVPLVNLIVFLYLAFAEWPVCKARAADAVERQVT